MISARRSQQEHDGVSSAIISFLTLGSVDTEHHPDFMALADGFNARMDAFADEDRPHHILEGSAFLK
jgi:hypothetical protein